jgi:hypothetical protein
MAIQEGGSNPPRGTTSRPWLPAALAAGSGFVVVGLLVLLWWGLQQKEIAGAKVVSVPFSNAPEFSLGLFDGSTFTLSDALKSGKPVVVNFWASGAARAPTGRRLQDAARRTDGQVTFVGRDAGCRCGREPS